MDIKFLLQKYTRREFWPSHIVYFPVYIYIIIVSIYEKTFGRISTSNPKMQAGGLCNYSKYDNLINIDPAYVPKSVCLSANISQESIQDACTKANIHYPYIVKPNFGDRGHGVHKINNLQDLKKHINTAYINQRQEILIQSFCGYTREFGVLRYTDTTSKKGYIGAITEKIVAFVIGDGIHAVSDLIKKDPRQLLYQDILLQDTEIDLSYIPKAGEKTNLGFRGNHCRGASFYHCHTINTDKLLIHLAPIAKSVGLYIGRFDLKADSYADLENGNFCILEINGAESEPTHMYDPSYGYWKGATILLAHRHKLYKIARHNKKLGTKHMSTYKLIHHIKTHFARINRSSGTQTSHKKH